MKKIIIFIVVCLLLTGCGNKDLNTNKDLNNLDEIPEENYYECICHERLFNYLP